jgi:ribosome-associated toxin RatA of RatAB toxin-antitoxin module
MQIRHTLLVAQPAERVYDVVADVERYPIFVPWCEHAHVVERTDEQYVTRMRIAIRKVGFELKTLTLTRRPESIAVRLQEGPFRTLEIDWSFSPLAADACRIGFSLDYELTPILEGPLSTSIAEKASRRIIDAFLARADQA